MTESLSNYILNPIIMIYRYILGDDFMVEGKKNLPYFIINLILSIIISFTGLVFNEFIILFCCGLEHNTYKQIIQRALPTKSEFEFSNKIKNDSENEIKTESEIKKLSSTSMRDNSESEIKMEIYSIYI